MIAEHKAERGEGDARSASPRTRGRPRSGSSRSSSPTSASLILDDVDGEFDVFGKTYDQRRRTPVPGRPEDLHDAGARPGRTTRRRPSTRARTSTRTRARTPRSSRSTSEHRRDQGDALGQGLPAATSSTSSGTGRRQVGSAFKPFTLVAAFREGFPPGQGVLVAVAAVRSRGWISASGCVSNAEGGRQRRLHGPVGGDAELRERGVRAARPRRRAREHRRDRAPHGHHVARSTPSRRSPWASRRSRPSTWRRRTARSRTTASTASRSRSRASRQPREAGGFRTIYKHPPQCKQVIDPDIAHLVTAMLERVVLGRARGRRPAGIGRPVAGKTGTAQDYTNVYFAGYTPQIATAVWVGFPYGQIPMDSYYGSSVFGGTVAAPIWHTFMIKAMQGYPGRGLRVAPGPRERQGPRRRRHADRGGPAGCWPRRTSRRSSRRSSRSSRSTRCSSQSPGGGASAVLGSAVTIQVSNGKGEPVVVPRVIGLRRSRPCKALEDLGLVAAVRVRRRRRSRQDGIVRLAGPDRRRHEGRSTSGPPITLHGRPARRRQREAGATAEPTGTDAATGPSAAAP